MKSASVQCRRRRERDDEPNRAQINTIQASLLAILGLLLGFTFSLSLQRYESRSAAVVDEANAAGTAYLRTELLPSSFRTDARALLEDYVELRIQAGAIALDNRSEWEALVTRSRQKLDTLWQCAAAATRADDRPVVSGRFADALNEVIDAFGRRNAALDRHVPELVLFLLFATFILTGSMVGYTSGIAGRRATFATYVLMSLIVLLVFVIVDLDRPRRGLIVVSQNSLVALRADMGASAVTQSSSPDSVARSTACRQ